VKRRPADGLELRGVFEETQAPDDARVLKFIGRQGEWLARLECRDDLLDTSVSDLAYQLLDLLEPPAPGEITGPPRIRLL
jgi:hypothetical protein